MAASVEERYSGAGVKTGKVKARVRAMIDDRILQLVNAIREKQEMMAALESEISVAKTELYELLDERGENWTDDEGYAVLVSEGLRIIYDRQALDRLIIEDPLRYGWLKDYRRASAVRGSVKVK
jgi:hypothetical protein